MATSTRPGSSACASASCPRQVTVQRLRSVSIHRPSACSSSSCGGALGALDEGLRAEAREPRQEARVLGVQVLEVELLVGAQGLELLIGRRELK